MTYTFPKSGPMLPCDEFYTLITQNKGAWCDVPESNLGEPIDGHVMVRRPYRPDPNKAADDLVAAVREISLTVDSLGQKLGVLQSTINQKEGA